MMSHTGMGSTTHSMFSMKRSAGSRSKEEMAAIYESCPVVATGLSHPRAIALMANRYGWDRSRVEKAIIKLADHMGATNEVYYPDPADYRQVVLVWVIRQRPGARYEVREENRPARLAPVSGVRYTSRVRTNRDSSVP